MSEQNTTTRTSSRPTHFALPPLHALVIGINEYASDKYHNLHSAVKDADDFYTYLTSRLHVPPQNIINLRDSNATRANILNAFTDLKNITSTDAVAQHGIGIIIFFAGHGARCEKPEEWEDWVTVGDFYEALCPSDIGTPEVRDDVEDEEVPPIPDRTIAALVNRLSETRGNNITLILDCCHSAGATRGSKDAIEAENEGYIPRHISNPPSISPNYDYPITANLTRGTGIARGFSGKNLSSHVLLAACGRQQFAYEHPNQPNGVFTYALLKVLNEINVEDLTYTSLMHRLNMPTWQNAHCDGTEVNRRLFNHITEGGILQGVTVGCTVSVHSSNLLPLSQQPNSSLSNLLVTEVYDASSTLEQPPSSAPSIPRMFYCKIIQRPSESLVISSPDIHWLESIYTKDFCTAHSISIVPDTKAADLILTPEGDRVYVDHHFPPAAKFIGVRSPFTIPSHNIWMLHEVVRCATNFRFHLLRTNAEISLDSELLSKINVRMEMKELEMTYNADYDFVAKPTGRDIFERDPAIIVVEREKRYGMTVDNLTDLPLYPHLFYFDPSELSITPWYLPPTGAGTSISTHKVDVILPPKSEFPIGYGEGGVDPWEFMLRDGEKKDFGFFKLFVTTTPVNLGNITQVCPYHASASRSGQVSALPAKKLEIEVWDTIVKGVLQVEVGSL